MWKKLRYILASALLLLGLSLVLWASLPIRDKVVEHILPPAAMKAGLEGERTTYALMENRKVRLEWPSHIRTGEQAKISLSFVQVEDGEPLLNPAGYEDAYKKFNLMAETRLEVAGVNVLSSRISRESLPAGQPIKASWEITADRPGGFQGKVWLSLRFLPLDGSAAIQVPIYIYDIEGAATSIFGLRAATAQLLGGVMMIIGLGMVIKDMVHTISNRLGKKKTDSEILQP